MQEYANQPMIRPQKISNNKVYIANLAQDTYGMFNADIQQDSAKESARSNSEAKNVREYLTERPGSRPVTHESSRKTFYSNAMDQSQLDFNNY